MGEWVSPDAGRVPLERWAEEWLAAYVGRARSTQERARSILRTHIIQLLADILSVHAMNEVPHHSPPLGGWHPECHSDDAAPLPHRT
jgi:hypothetical protein